MMKAVRKTNLLLVRRDIVYCTCLSIVGHELLLQLYVIPAVFFFFFNTENDTYSWRQDLNIIKKKKSL